MESINRALFADSDGLESVAVIHHAVASVIAEGITPTLLFTGNLSLKVVSAANIPSMDSGLPDPYCVILAEEERLAKTKAISKSSAPLWNEEFDLEVVSCRVMTFAVKDRDLLSKDNVVAKVTKSNSKREKQKRNPSLTDLWNGRALMFSRT